LAGVDSINLGLIEQRFDLQLRVQNSNRFALPVQGMEFVLQRDDHDFAHGVTYHTVTIPAFGETLVEVSVVSNMANLYEQLRDRGTGDKNRLRYKLSGGVGLSYWAAKIPFESQSEIMLAPQPRKRHEQQLLLLHDPVL
jgi:LEA14-like dessication related protein